MQSRLTNIIVGLLLIAAGLVFLAQNLGYIGELSPQAWMVISAGLSVIFLVAYLINGLQSWPWLIPTGVFAGLALTIFLGEAGAAETLVPLPILAGVGLPFFLTYLINRRENWWALIPAWVMLVIMAIIPLSEVLAGELIATVVLCGIGLPFLFVYFSNRENWWALIPGGILCGIGLVIGLASQAQDNLLATLILLAVAAPFLILFLISRSNWWALIPGGTLVSVALAIGLLGSFEESAAEVWINVFIMGGLALTFTVLWLRRASSPTGWAWVPALIFLAGAVLAGVFRINIFDFWPVLLVLLGVILLYSGLQARSTRQVEG